MNGGEISRRLRGRSDLSIYDISVEEMTGYVPLIEGGAEACPGLIWVEKAKADCRLIPFEFNVTQGQIVEASNLAFRFYTNDARIEDEGDPVELVTPYTIAQVRALDYAQSFDVLYLFHGAVATRALVRTGGDEFELEAVEFRNGPFEARNQVESLIVNASAVAGTGITLNCPSADLFEPGDVGGLFQMEAGDFGSIASWEPGITVTGGQLLTWLERVYRVVTSSGRTGTVEPLHTEGVEWDGIGQGTDVNGTAAGGVQLEYVHDRFGLLKITAYVDARTVTADVLRRLPLTAIASGSTEWDGGYWDDAWTWVPPVSSITYVYGTWRWRFGAFSTRRGFAQAGSIWSERLWLAKDSTIYAGVTGDFTDHATYNENGDISADMAIVITLKDPNRILQMVPAGSKLLVLTASGTFSIGPASAAAPLGPGNIRIDRENHAGAAAAKVAEIDGRVVYIGRSRRRIYEAAYEVTRDAQDAADLTRYARHMGNPRFGELAATKDPERLLWSTRDDGTLAVSAYVPEEQVLGWAARPLATGMAAKSCASITDPAGELQQLWVAASFGGDTHVLRLAQFRHDGEYDDTGVMLDMAAIYEGEAESEFVVAHLAGQTVEAVADGKWWSALDVDEAGNVEIPEPAERVVIGLPFAARLRFLPPEAGGDSGPAMSKMQRISRQTLLVESARGLRITADGGLPMDVEQLEGNSTTDAAFDPDSGLIAIERASDWQRRVSVLVERVAPFQGTILAWQPEVETSPR